MLSSSQLHLFCWLYQSVCIMICFPFLLKGVATVPRLSLCFSYFCLGWLLMVAHIWRWLVVCWYCSQSIIDHNCTRLLPKDAEEKHNDSAPSLLCCCHLLVVQPHLFLRFQWITYNMQFITPLLKETTLHKSDFTTLQSAVAKWSVSSAHHHPFPICRNELRRG